MVLWIVKKIGSWEGVAVSIPQNTRMFLICVISDFPSKNPDRMYSKRSKGCLNPWRHQIVAFQSINCTTQSERVAVCQLVKPRRSVETESWGGNNADRKEKIRTTHHVFCCEPVCLYFPIIIPSRVRTKQMSYYNL